MLVESGDHTLNTHDGEHSLDVVGYDTQTHFCLYLLACTEEKVALVHPSLECAKDVLDQGFALLEQLRAGLQSLLHFVPELFICPARDAPPLLVLRTACFQWAGFAGFGSIVAGLAAFFEGLEAECELCTSRTAVAITLAIVAEVFFGKQALLLIARGVGFGDKGARIWRHHTV